MCTGVLCSPCGPSALLEIQQESGSREQQHTGADGDLSHELVSIVKVIGFGLGGEMTASERLRSLGVNEVCGAMV